jgi:hypothetical protein
LPDPDYRLYAADPDSNTAGSPIGAPEGGYKGSWVNDTLRFLMATVRRLGDGVPKVDGDTFTGDSIVGALAFRDAVLPADIALLPGVVMVGGIIDFYGTLTQAVAYQPQGWLVCDGRTATIAGTAYTSPDYRGLYPRYFSATIAPKDTGGSLTTATDGGGGATSGTALTMAQLPAGLLVNAYGEQDAGGLFAKGNTARIDQDANAGGGQTHAHTIPAHAHAVNPPPYAAVIPLLRVF